MRDGALSPLHLFRHGFRSIYIKTNGGFYGAKQFIIVIISHISHLKYESKLFIQTIKTPIINCFTSWCLFKCPEHMGTLQSFKYLDKFRYKLNSFYCIPDFFY